MKAKAIINPVDQSNIAHAEHVLGIKFSDEYKSFLNTVGVVSFKDKEIFGLGVPDSSYLNIIKATTDLKSLDQSFPQNAIPLFDIGDGHYYLYDNIAEVIIVWATPNGGVVKTIAKPLENFLSELLFSN